MRPKQQVVQQVGRSKVQKSFCFYKVYAMQSQMKQNNKRK